MNLRVIGPLLDILREGRRDLRRPAGAVVYFFISGFFCSQRVSKILSSSHLPLWWTSRL